MSETKKRSSTLAVLFNVFSPGLGFLYAGKLTYAIGFPLVFLLLIGVFSWSKLMFNPISFTFFTIIGCCIYLSGLIIVAKITRKTDSVELVWYQRWYVYVVFYVISSVISTLLMANRDVIFGYDMYRFPSGSMENTLTIGDFIISDTTKYKNSTPQRGDVIVFLYPEDPTIKYVKRIIGLPGDTVEISFEEVYINGKKLDEPYVNHGSNLFPIQNITGVKYNVPEEAYFVLGDNRNNSRDSRAWGFLPENHIIGSVEFIWFSYFPGEGIRTKRIGNIVK